MIRIAKRTQAPAILRRRGSDATASMRRDYDADPPGYRAGVRTWTFDSGLYGAPSVKNALIHDQHDKCCFCESKLTHVSYGDVEHFRPKAGWRQAESDDLARPGYYWLAYSWSNLFLCCQLCNQRHKKNLFPLSDPATRATDHRCDVEAEAMLFVAPDGDPEAHVTFEADAARGLTEAGRVCVTELGLNRDQLIEKRREALAPVLLLVQAVEILAGRADLTPTERQRVGDMREHLDLIRRDDAEYASMFRANLPKV